jgi:hypothetical protein
MADKENCGKKQAGPYFKTFFVIFAAGLRMKKTCQLWKINAKFTFALPSGKAPYESATA